MTYIAPVSLSFNPKVFWFDAGNLTLQVNDRVAVRTVRGLELGTVVREVFEATPENIAALKSPLRPVVRVATEEDIAQFEVQREKSRDAMPIFRKIVAEEQLAMRPILVEYLLEGDKAIFYFEADERIDFRELVRKLAAQLHIRVDMRQIGPRDEARMVGGLGHCGQELCCKRLGGEFNPVSIRMAKEQDLSLNPQKISGLCGRLMCCLRYEFDAYKDFKSRAPKLNAKIETPDGILKVTSLDVPRELVMFKTEEGKTVSVPLADMEGSTAESPRPTRVGSEAWERALAPKEISLLATSLFTTSQFTSSSALGNATAVHTPKMESTRSTSEGSLSRGKSGKNSSRQNRSKKQGGQNEKTESRRSRRSLSKDGGKSGVSSEKRSRLKKHTLHADASSSTDVSKKQSNVTSTVEHRRIRPGHKSSALSHETLTNKETLRTQASEKQPQDGKNKSRRRQVKIAASASQVSKQKQPATQASRQPQSAKQAPKQQRSAARTSKQKQTTAQVSKQQQSDAAPKKDAQNQQQRNQQGQSHRRRRRRSGQSGGAQKTDSAK